MNTACHESCKTHGPGKVNPGHDLYGYMRHAWHQCSCSLHHSTTTRHDQVLTILQKYFRTYCGILAEQGQFLNRDNDTRKSTDLLLTFPNWPGARSMSVDYTCLCPYLPKYSASASANFAKAQADREKDKVDHHAEWCREVRIIATSSASPAPRLVHSVLQAVVAAEAVQSVRSLQHIK